jgi:uncharacterized small protein (DUF1192 family)
MAQHWLIVRIALGELAAVAAFGDEAPQPLPVEGSPEPLPCPDAAALKNALADLYERLDSERSSRGAVLLCLLADGPGRSAWSELLRQQRHAARWDNDGWELHRWESVSRWSDAPADSVPGLVEIAHWLPRVCADPRRLGQSQADALQESLAKVELERKVGVLQQTIERLQAENSALSDQIDALGRPDIERLVTYLPALYRHFFASVPPADLALLCGYLKPPTLPNPWPEPAPESLRQLQAKFRNLPVAEQRRAIDLARSLPQAARLEPRAEMKEYLRQFEAGDAP